MAGFEMRIFFHLVTKVTNERVVVASICPRAPLFFFLKNINSTITDQKYGVASRGFSVCQNFLDLKRQALFIVCSNP